MSEIKFDFSPFDNDTRLCYAIKEIEALSDRDRQRLLSAMYKQKDSDSSEPITVERLLQYSCSLSAQNKKRLLKELIDRL